MPHEASEKGEHVTSKHGMRLLHVVTRNNARGAERVAVELGRALSLHGWAQRTVALYPGNPAQGDLGLPVMGQTSAHAILALRREIRRGAPDVILAHGGTAAMLAVAASLATPSKVVWQRILEFPGSTWHSPVRRRAWSIVARHCIGVIALSDKAATEMQRLGFSGPVQTIPNHRPSPPRRGKQHPTIQALRGRGRAVVGFVGHLVDQKDPLAAVRVAERLVAMTPNVDVVMAGDGPLRADVEAAIGASDHHERLHMLGHVDDVRSGLLPHLDALFITSRTESMTGVAVEALLAQCPVISYALDGLDVLLAATGAGTLVPLGNEEALASEMFDVLSNPERAQGMRDAARDHHDRFLTETVATTYSDFLTRCVRPRPTTDPMARSPRKVAHLIPNIGVGGAEQALAVLTATHDRRRWEPIVVTLHPPRRPKDETVIPEIEAAGAHLVDLKVPGRADRSPVALLRAIWRLRRLLRSEGVAVLDSALFEADVTARLATIGLKTANVTHLVNTTYDDVVRDEIRGRGTWRFNAVRRLDRATGRRTAAFIALTEAVAESAKRHVAAHPERVHVVPRGVSLQQFPHLPLKPAAPRRLLTVGRLVPQKNHLRLLKALAQTEDLTLTIVGEGPLVDEIRRTLDRLDLGHRVELRPPTRNVAALHAEHDAFVLPSLWEGQSNALLEAMAGGRPVLAADIPVLNEVLGGAAIFADPADVTALADGLRRLARSTASDRRAWSEHLRERVENYYSADSATRALEQVYDRVAMTPEPCLAKLTE